MVSAGCLTVAVVAAPVSAIAVVIAPVVEYRELMALHFSHKALEIRPFVSVPSYAAEREQAWEKHIFGVFPSGDILGPEIGLDSLDV